MASGTSQRWWRWAGAGLVLVWLTGCAAYRTAQVPMPSLSVPVEAGRTAPALIVFLPGAQEVPKDILDEGLVAEVKRQGLDADVIVADGFTGNVVLKTLEGGLKVVIGALLEAFVSTPEIWEVLIPNPVIHSTTFGGNPMACAAGIAAITVTLEEDLPGQAAAKGDFMMEQLWALQARYPQVLTSVSGKGLLIGLEFPSDAIGYQFAGGLFRRGVLVAGTYSKARTIRLEPSLGIPMDLLQEVLNRIEDTFREIVATRRDA